MKKLKVVPKCIRFDYISDFICDAQYCDASCCHEWGIEIDVVTLHKYRNLSDNNMSREIGSNMEYRADRKTHRFMMDSDLKCSFLDSDNLCKLQRTLGEDYLSDTCCIYPRVYTKVTDEYMVESMTVSCPVVGKKLLDYPGKISLEEVNEIPARRRMLFPLETHPWRLKHFLDIQCAGIAILQNTQLSMRQRLMNLFVFGQAMQEIFIKEKNDAEFEEFLSVFMQSSYQQEIGKAAQNIVQVTNSFVKDFFDLYDKFLMAKNIDPANKLYKPYRKWLFEYYNLASDNSVGELAVLYHKAEIAYQQHILQKYPFFRENYYVNEWFGLKIPEMVKGTIVENIEAYLLYMRMTEMLLMILAVHKGEDITEKDIAECISYMARIFEHNLRLLKVCSTYLQEKKFEMMDFLKIWLFNEDF